MKSFIAFSGGVESSAMCVLYGKDSIPIFTDAGWEHKVMLERLDFMQKALHELHGPQCTIIRLKPENIEGTGANSLPEYIKIRKFMPWHKARFCTRLGKIAVMDKFLAQQGDCEVLIGLNADEADERVGNYGACKNVRYRYPLIEGDLDRGDCERILKNVTINRVNLLPAFPPYMNRGGCVGCYMKSKREYAAMALLAPEEAYSVADLEESIQDRREKFFSILPSGQPMRQFIEESRSTLLPASELYPEDKTPETSCGVFCMR